MPLVLIYQHGFLVFCAFPFGHGDITTFDASPFFFFMYLCIFVPFRLYFSAFMSSTSMAELRSNGIGVPILFPIDAHGIDVVSDLHLSIRLSLKANTIWVEREISNLDTGLVVQTLHESSKLIDNGNVIWELGAGKYRVYGLPDSQMGVSQKILTSPRSSTSSLSTPPVISVNSEPDVDNVIDLSDSSFEDVPVQMATVHNSPPFVSLCFICNAFSFSLCAFISSSTVYVQTSSTYSSVSSSSWFYVR